MRVERKEPRRKSRHRKKLPASTIEALDEIERDLEWCAEDRANGKSLPEWLATPSAAQEYLTGWIKVLVILKVEQSRLLRWEDLCKRLGLPRGRFQAVVKAEQQRLREQEAGEAAERHQAEVEQRSQALLNTDTDLFRIHAGLEELSSATHDLIELLLAVAISLPITQAEAEALVWLLAVGVPSSDKTNQVTLLREMPNIYFLDTLTENAFVTGYVPESGERPKDLLAELDGRCLVVKELGTLFSLKAELIRKVLGDLQAIYDGHFSKYTGTRGRVEYKAAFPLIGCVTPLALNQHQRYMASIGPRFLFYRLLPLTEKQVQEGFELSWQAGGRGKRLEELRRLVSAYGWQLYNNMPKLVPETPEQQTRLNELARFLSSGRAVALTDRYQERSEEGKTFTVYENAGSQKEEPFRALQQLRGLGRSLACVHRRTQMTDHEMEMLRRVALSSMPPERADTLLLFQEGSRYLRSDGGLTRRKAAEGLTRSYNHAKRLLQELEGLGLIEAVGGGESQERVYYPAGQFKRLITTPLLPLDHLLDLHGMAAALPASQDVSPTEILVEPQGEVSGRGDAKNFPQGEGEKTEHQQEFFPAPGTEVPGKE